VALADAADGRVAAHLADGFQVLGKQERAGAMRAAAAAASVPACPPPTTITS